MPPPSETAPSDTAPTGEGTTSTAEDAGSPADKPSTAEVKPSTAEGTGSSSNTAPAEKTRHRRMNLHHVPKERRRQGTTRRRTARQRTVRHCLMGKHPTKNQKGPRLGLRRPSTMSTDFEEGPVGSGPPRSERRRSGPRRRVPTAPKETSPLAGGPPAVTTSHRRRARWANSPRPPFSPEPGSWRPAGGDPGG